MALTLGSNRKAGLCAGGHCPTTQGEAWLCYAWGLWSLWNGSQEASISLLLSTPSLSMYMSPLFLKSHLIGECSSAEDDINSNSFTGNIQKTI